MSGSCGRTAEGSVVFTGTARNHADGRSDVTALEYEAYAEQVAARRSSRVASQAASALA